MASIVKRKKKYSVVYNFTNGDGEKKQKWESFDTHKDALRRKNEVESQQDSGTFIPPSDVTLKDFLYDYVKIYGTTHWALSTYEQNVGLISNYITPLIATRLSRTSRQNLWIPITRTLKRQNRWWPITRSPGLSM